MQWLYSFIKNLNHVAHEFANLQIKSEQDKQNCSVCIVHCVYIEQFYLV